MKTLLLSLSLLISTSAVAAPKKAKPAPAPVTRIDMSTPDAPESQFPTVSKKGPL